MTLSAEHAASERDAYDRLVVLALSVSHRDVNQLRLGARDCLTAARWAALASPSDPRLLRYLRLSGQFAAAAVASMQGNTVDRYRLDETLLQVPARMPAGWLRAHLWRDALCAATAVDDAATAVTLARAQPELLEHNLPQDAFLFGRALAACWVEPSRAGQRLVAALEAGTSDDLSLDVTSRDVAVLYQLLKSEDGALAKAFADAEQGFARVHGVTPRDADGAFSLPLAALARLALARGRPVPAAGRCIPEVILRQPPATLLGCPLCSQPRDPLETKCRWCSADLENDAPLELSVADVAGANGVACRHCARANLPTALRCWSCAASLPAA